MNKTIFLLAAIISTKVWALNLGSMSVTSSAEERFNASIKIISSDAVEISSLELENSEKSFINNKSFIDTNQIIVDVKRINGQQFISLSSDEILKGNYYDFNLRINTVEESKTVRYFGFIPEISQKVTMIYREPVKSLSSCLELVDPIERLECYDKSLDRKDQDNDKRLIVSENKTPKSDASKDDLFGKRGGELEEVIAKTQKIVIPTNLSNVVTKVTRYEADKYILTLKNGQQWKVLEPSRKGYFKINQNINISKGLFGSFDLNVENLNKKYKVKREE